jgi:hypothetical protein
MRPLSQVAEMSRGSRVAAILLAAIGLQSLHSQEAPDPNSGTPATGFEPAAVSFVSAYCTSCQGEKGPAGGLSLDDIDLNVSGRDFEVWRVIDERVRFGEMPPPESEQSTSELRRGVLKLLRAELLKTQQPRSYVPRLPMPISPTTIRSLGATAPFNPKAETGNDRGSQDCGAASRHRRLQKPAPVKFRSLLRHS